MESNLFYNDLKKPRKKILNDAMNDFYYIFLFFCLCFLLVVFKYLK